MCNLYLLIIISSVNKHLKLLCINVITTANKLH